MISGFQVGSDAETLRTATLALIHSAAEYRVPLSGDAASTFTMPCD